MKTLKAKELAIYLGCECMADERRATIEGVSTHPLIEMVTVRFIDTDDDWTVHNDLSQIKPILRPLSDMTDEEAIWIGKEVLFKGYHGFKPRIETSKDRIIVYGKSAFEGDHVEILFHGEIVTWVDGKWNPARFECSFEIIPYLLSKHFDLFGWIEQGLAIDKTTLKLKSL